MSLSKSYALKNNLAKFFDCGLKVDEEVEYPNTIIASYLVLDQFKGMICKK